MKLAETCDRMCTIRGHGYTGYIGLIGGTEHDEEAKDKIIG